MSRKKKKFHLEPLKSVADVSEVDPWRRLFGHLE